MSNDPRSDAPAQGVTPDPAQANSEPSDNGADAVSNDAPTSAESPGEHAVGTASDGGASGDNGVQNEAEPSPPDTPAAEPTPEERIGQLEVEKAQLERDKQDHWERLLRVTADLDNYRKRSRRELDDARIDARTSVLKEMLPVIDNLERAVQHAEGNEGGDQETIVEGVKLVLRQFAQALERCEVRPVDAVGKPFDPNLHEAISQLETSEYPPGSVVQAFQAGYTIGNRLLRPALVVVAKAPADPAPGSSGPNGSDAASDSAAGASSDVSGGEGEA